MLAVHWLCIAVCFADPRNKGQSGKALGLVLWVCPALSVLIGAVTYLTALGLQPFSMDKIMLIFMGLLFIVIGNYLPKCRRNYTIGIKVPWALDNEEKLERHSPLCREAMGDLRSGDRSFIFPALGGNGFLGKHSHNTYCRCSLRTLLFLLL